MKIVQIGLEKCKGIGI